MNARDVELLSSYLDGQLSPSDSTRLEARLRSDPGLSAALDAMRKSRSLLRRLPKRRAPRNLTLTPRMVGKNPPLPRAYPVLRFASAFAALLFAFSYIANRIPVVAFGAAAPAAEPAYGMGGGGPAATEPPAAAPEMELMMTEAPATEPPADFAPAGTPAPGDRVMEIPSEAASKTGNGRLTEVPREAPGLTPWQMVFAAVALLGGAGMLIVRRAAAQKWLARK
ncbi:MAG: hypothetical protein AB1564_03740 [Chloroflexota bacterium]